MFSDMDHMSNLIGTGPGYGGPQGDFYHVGVKGPSTSAGTYA